MDDTSNARMFKPGDVFYQFEVIRRLGAGLHGEVYLVEHRHTRDRFALKMMHLEDVTQASRVRRALSTALANYRIQHANVVKVHNLSCEEDGRVWVLMEYLEGCSIGDLLARQRGRVSIPLALHIAIEAAWGIDAAHEMRIIHRDIKPENLWLSSQGTVLVIDFSLAKVIPDGIQTTQHKTGFGTAPYMAPEALRAVDPDARVDIYALGIVLWQMLGGTHPFQSVMRDTTEMIRRQLYVAVPRLSEVAGLPAYVDTFMDRALAKSPTDRFLTMAEMAQAMLKLRDRLRADAERGELIVEVAAGEPRFADSPWRRRAYHAARAVMDSAPDRGHSARVIVGGASAPTMGPGGTLPLGLTLPSGAATLVPSSSTSDPLSDDRPTRHDVRTAAPAASATPGTAPAPPSLRDTGRTATRSAPGEASSDLRRPRRVGLVALALATAFATCIGVLALRPGQRTPATLDAASSASIPIEPAASSMDPSVPAVILASAPNLHAQEAPEPHAIASSSPLPASAAPASRVGSPRPPHAGTTRADNPPPPSMPTPPSASAAPPPTPAPPPKPVSNRLFGAEP